MNLRHTANRPACGNALGFSMIDALIAILVMATALLALAVLQGNLTRNTVDARARSQLAQYGDSLIDQARQGGYDLTVSKTRTTTPGPLTYDATAASVQTAAGVSNLQAATTVTEYTYADPNVPGGNTNAACTGTFVTSVGTCPPSANVTAYKNVSIALTWTDASSASRSLTENTIVSALQLDSGTGLTNNSNSSGSVTSPVVREVSPVVPGVIPIAIGSGTDTAATNPRPELSGITNATSYNVLTYKDLTTQVRIQQRIETTVIGCSCQYGQQSATRAEFLPAWRPTYWDGTHYVEPSPAHASSAGEDANASGRRPALVQSPLCTYCCRDHRDYSGDQIDINTGNTYLDDPVNFDPWRKVVSTDVVADHRHYKWSTIPAPGSFVEVTASNTTNPYMEACRMIRVNGLWRTSTDLNAEQVGLLATESQADANAAATPVVAGGSTQPATNWIPTVNAEVDYQTFVKDYFDQKIAQGGSPVAATLYHNDSLDDTGSGATYLDFNGTAEYLHTRGLYLDNLEVAAKKQIQDAITHCSGSTIDCVLPYIPFTSINLTEVAIWGAPTSGQGVANNLQVLNGSGVLGNFNLNTTPPIRGKVTASSGGGNEEDILLRMTASNSGLAGGTPATSGQQSIDPNDATLVAHYSGDPALISSPATAYTDMQHFRVRASAGDSFTVNAIGATSSDLLQVLDSITNNDPVIAWYKTDLSDGNDCTTSYSLTDSNPNPYTCNTDLTLSSTSPVVAGTNLQLWVQKYNYIKYVTEANPCDSTQPQVSHPYCEYNAVSEVDLAGIALFPQPTVDTSTNTGKVSEISKMTVPLIPANGQVTIKFRFTGETAATAKTCDTTSVPGQSIFAGFNTPPCQ